MTNLSFETAYALFRRLPEYTAVDLDALGVSKADLELVSGPLPWRRDHVDKVCRALVCFIHGTTEILRMPKMTVPAEYVAPIIAAAVGPANQQLACIWMAQEKQTGVSAMDLSQRAQTTTQVDPTTPEQLFSLVCLLMAANGANAYRERFATQMGYKIQVEMDKEMEGSTPKGKI